MGGYSTFLNFGQFAISLISVPLLSMVDGSIPALFAQHMGSHGELLADAHQREVHHGAQ